MSEYIKLEDAINEMTRLSKEQIEQTGYDTAPIEDIVDILANLPTTDIDDYCSYGERRE